MLEDFITNLLSDYLDKYLENFDSTALQISWMKGDVQISNLSINPNALQNLHPALQVQRGTISQLKIKMNMMKPKSEPVVAIIDDLLLLVTPKKNITLNESDIEKILKEAFTEKLQQMLNTQILFEEAIEEKKKKGMFSSFVGNLTISILNNLKIQINGFHVRYEDTSIPYAIGMTMNSLKIMSVDKNGKETFFSDTEININKLLQIQDVALYCDNHIIPISNATKQQQDAFLKQTISTEHSFPKFNYLVQPMSVTVNIQLDKSEPNLLKNPKNKIDIQVHNLNFNISSQQVNVIMKSIQEFVQFGTNQKKLSCKPKESIAENAPQWLRYIFVNDLQQIQLDQEILEKYEYKTYIQLFAEHYINSNTKDGLNQKKNYKKQLEEKKITSFDFPFCKQWPIMCDTEANSKEMHQLHSIMKQYDVQLCRTIVLKKLYKKNYDDLKKSAFKLQIPDEEYQQLLQQEKKELLEQQEKQQYSNQSTLLDFNLSFDKIFLQLNTSTILNRPPQQIEITYVSGNQTQVEAKKSKWGVGTQKKIEQITEKLPVLIGSTIQINEICYISIKQINTKLKLFANKNINLEGKISSFEIINKLTKIECEYPIIARKVPSNYNELMTSIMTEEQVDDPDNLQLKFDFQMINQNLAILNAVLKPISIVYTPDVQQIINLIVKDSVELAKEQENNKAITAFIDYSDQQWVKLKEYSQHTIQEVVKNHFRINVNVELQAPVIIIPTVKTVNKSIGIINLGSLTVQSNMKETTSNITDDNVYDNYQAQLKNVFIFVAQSPTQVSQIFRINQQLDNCNQVDKDLFDRQVILQPANIKAEIKNCFVKNYFNSDKLIINVFIQSIQCHISEQNANQIVNLLEFLTLHILQPLQHDQKKKEVQYQEKINTIKASTDITQERSATDTSNTQIKYLKRQQKILRAIANDESLKDSENELDNELEQSSTMVEFETNMIGDHTKEEIAKYVKMRLNISLEQIQLKIFGTSCRTTQDQLISSVQINLASFSYVHQPYSKSIQFNLQQINIIDNIENLYFISSPVDKYLLKCQTIKYNKKHPEYKNNDLNIDLSICGLQIIYDPLYARDITYYGIQKYHQFQKFMSSEAKQQQQKKHDINIEKYIDLSVCEKACRKLIQNKKPEQFKVTEVTQKISLHVDIGDCSISLKKANSKDMFTQFILQGSKIDYLKYNHTQAIRIFTKGFNVVDFYKNTIHNNVIQTPTDNDNGIEFNMFIIDPFSPDFCGYETEISIQVAVKIQVTFMMRYIFQLQQYFANEKEDLDMENSFQQSIDNAKSSAYEGVQQRFKQVGKQYKMPSLKQINIAVNIPLIKVPINDREQQVIQLDLGKLTINTDYYIGTPGQQQDNDIASNIPIEQYTIKVEQMCVLIKQNNDQDDYNNYQLLEPNNLIIKYCSPITSISAEEAKQKGQLPGIYISIAFDNKFQATINTQQIDLLMGLIKCYNNFGYDIIDDDEVSEAKCKLLGAQLKQLKNDLLTTMSLDQLKDKIQQKFSKSDIDKITDFTIAGQQLTKNQKISENENNLVMSYQAIGEETQNIMRIAIYINVPGFELQLRGSRDSDKNPINNSLIGIKLTVNQFTLDFKMFSQTFKMAAKLKSIVVSDQRAANYLPQFKNLFETDGELQLMLNKAVNGNQEMQLNCQKSIQCNLIFATFFYLIDFWMSPVDVKHKELLSKREQKQTIQKKQSLLEQYLRLAHQIKFQLSNEQFYKKNQKSLLNTVANENISQQADSIIKQNNELFRFNLKVNLPKFQVSIPQDPTDNETKILQMNMEFYLDFQMNSDINKVIDQSGIKWQTYNGKHEMIIVPQLYGLCISIVQQEDVEMMLNDVGLELRIEVYSIDTLLNYEQQQIIKREKDVIVRGIIQNPICFKMTYSDADFLVQMMKQIHKDYSQQATGQLSQDSSVQQLCLNADTDEQLILSTEHSDSAHNSSQNQVWLDISLFENLQQTSTRMIPKQFQESKLLLEDASVVDTVKNSQFTTAIALNRSDVKIQSEFVQGLTVSLIDDRQNITPLVEFKMPTFFFEGALNLITESHVMKQNFVITVQLLADVYSQRVFDWEPLIENIAFTFTYSFDSVINPIDNKPQEQTTMILKTQGVFQINITPNVILTINQIIEMVKDVFEQKQKQIEYPLLYQKVSENDIKNFEDVKDETMSRNTTSIAERSKLFKQCHCYNATSCTIQINNRDESQCLASLSQGQHEYFDFPSHEQMVTITVYETDSEVSHKFYSLQISKQGVQFLTLNKENVFIDIQMHERQLYILIRPRIQFLNKSGLKLYVNTADDTILPLEDKGVLYIVNQYEQRNIQIQTQEEQSIQQSIVLDLKQTIPGYGFSQQKFFRIETQKTSTPGGDVLNITIYPTFQVRNDCLAELNIDGNIILPGQVSNFYVNPLISFKVNELKVAGLKQQQLTLATLITRVPKEVNIDTQQLLLENKQNKLIYLFVKDFEVINTTNNAKTRLGLHRVFKYRQNSVNQFQHEITIYPKIVLQNILSTFNHSQIYQDVTTTMKNAKKTKRGDYCVKCHIGDAVVTPALEDDQVCIGIQYGALKMQSKAIQMNTTKLTVPCDSDELTANIVIQLGKNKLTRVVSVKPKRAFRNFCNKELIILIAPSNQPRTDTAQVILQPHSPPYAVLYSGQYIFVQNNIDTSSAIPISENGVFAVYNDDQYISIQITSSEDIDYVDFFDKKISLLEIVNKTSKQITVQQNLQLDQFSKKSKQSYTPSIKPHQNRGFTIKNNQKQEIYLQDLSIPPVINILYQNQQMPIVLNKLGRRKPIQVGDQLVFVQVDCVNNKKTVEISNKPMKKNCAVSLINAETRLSVQHTLSLQVEQVNVSLFQTTGEHSVKYQKQIITANNVPVELFCLQINNILLQKLTLQETEVFIAQLDSLSLLNMQPEANNYQVLEIESSQKQAINFQAERLLESQFYTLINFQLNKICLNIDQSFYESGFQYIQQFSKEQQQLQYDAQFTQIAVIKYLLPKTPKVPTPKLENKLFYIGYLQIEPLQAIISLQLTNITSSNNLIMTLFNTFGTTLASLTNAELHFSRLLKQNILLQKNELQKQLQQFYTKQLIHNLGNIVKSAFLIGNISDAASSFGEGINDLMEAQTMQQRMNGLASLGKHAITGYLSVISGATTTVSNITSNLAFDKKYMTKRNQYLRESKKSGTKAVQNAFKSFGEGLFEGVTGIITQPILGGQNEGGIGVLKGIGRGIAGIFTKPVSGTVDLVSHLSIAAQVGINGEQQQVREQRVYWDGIIKHQVVQLKNEETKLQKRPSLIIKENLDEIQGLLKTEEGEQMKKYQEKQDKFLSQKLSNQDYLGGDDIETVDTQYDKKK